MVCAIARVYIPKRQFLTSFLSSFSYIRIVANQCYRFAETGRNLSEDGGNYSKKNDRCIKPLAYF